jgi:hypothetical protein
MGFLMRPFPFGNMLGKGILVLLIAILRWIGYLLSEPFLEEGYIFSRTGISCPQGSSASVSQGHQSFIQLVH